MTAATSHMSFLEELAREEFRFLNFNEYPVDGGTSVADENGTGQNNNNVEVDEEERLEEERNRVFLMVDFSSHDDDEDFMSESDYFSSDDEEDLSDDSNSNMEEEDDDVIDVDALSDSDGDNVQHAHLNDAADVDYDRHSVNDQLDIVNTEATNIQQDYALSPMPMLSNDIYQRIGSLLFNLSNSEERPLIRADIPWSIISSCDAPLLTTLYKRSLDPGGTMLLQGMLRMDPPLDAVKKIIDAFPLSCVDMEGFFTACQFAQPRTSRQMRPVALDFCSDGKMSVPEDSYDDDVGEVVRLIMRETIIARRSRDIGWVSVLTSHVSISRHKSKDVCRVE